MRKLIELEGYTFRLERQIYVTTLLPDLFPKSPGMNHSFLDFYKASLMDGADRGTPQVERPEE